MKPSLILFHASRASFARVYLSIVTPVCADSASPIGSAQREATRLTPRRRQEGIKKAAQLRAQGSRNYAGNNQGGPRCSSALAFSVRSLSEEWRSC